MGKRFNTKDGTLSYFVSQLDNLDPKLYQPLSSVTWSRDIKLRTGISMGNESTSFIRQAIAGAGTLSALTNMPWISPETTAIPGVQINGERVITPLRLLAREISYTSVELDRSQMLGQSLDSQQIDALNFMYNQNIDRMVYVGDTTVSSNATGLFNSSAVSIDALANAGTWATKTPAQILADVNKILNDAWAASGYAFLPTKLIVPPAQLGYLASTMINTAGNQSILGFLQQNNIAKNTMGTDLEIVSSKWLVGAGAGATDRMVAYTNMEDKVRFPMVPIRRETPYYYGIRYTCPYVWAFGQVEVVYPETILYMDGI